MFGLHRHLNPATPITACVVASRTNSGGVGGGESETIVSGDTLGLVKCFEVDGVRVVWSVTLVSRDAVNKTAVTSLASLPLQQVACGMFGLVHIIHTTCGATLQTLTFESGGGGDPQWVNVISSLQW